MRVGNKEMRAHSSAASLLFLLTLVFATSNSLLFTGPHRSPSVGLRHDHQRIVARRFFDKIAESFQAMVNPEEGVQRKLAKMSDAARLQVQESLKSMMAARDAARAELAASNDALAKLQAARISAQEACIVDWAEEEEKWDISLAACAEPALKAADLLEAQLASLANASGKLASAAKACFADSEARVEAAKAAASKLPADSQQSLASEVAEASQPLVSDGKLLRIWVLSSAEAKDIYRDLESLKSEANQATNGFVKQLRDLRAAKAAEEKARAEEEKRKAEAAAKAAAEKVEAEAAAKAAAEAAAKAEAESSSQNQGIALVVALVVAVGAFGLKLKKDPTFLGPENPITKVVAQIAKTP